MWDAKKDPSPEDHTFEIQDWEFNKQRGKWFGFKLSDFEKRELTRRQIYYQLNGGTLGTGVEASANDTIIIDLNIIYQRENYNATTAQNEFGKYVADAVNAYGQIDIKFNIDTWTPGDAKFVYRSDGFLDARITEGARAGFHNVIFGRRNNTNERVSYTTFDAQYKPIATFLYKGALGDGDDVFINHGLRTHALAHELGHAFGLLGSAKITDPYDRNKDADWDVDLAVIKLLSGQVKKGVHWKRTGIPLPNASGQIEYFTIFDKIRAGARAMEKV